MHSEQLSSLFACQASFMRFFIAIAKGAKLVHLLNLHMITYGRKDLASHPLPSADIFPGVQVASDALVSTEAAQHPRLCGPG